MKLPKMLPWLARSAGLPMARVEELWYDAIRHAAAETGSVDTPHYWKAANDRLLELIETEALAAHPPHYLPWICLQTTSILLPRIAVNAFAGITTATLAKLAGRLRRAC